MRVRSSTRDCSSPIARLSSLITAHSTRPVNTTVLMNASSSSSDSLRGAVANGPISSLRVYQSASAHTTAIAVVTSRWPKRNAAHTMSGTMTKVRPKPLLNATCVAARSRAASSRPSSALRGVHCTAPRTLQLRISGVKIRMPEVSPCHQVRQLANRSAPGKGYKSASGISATVGAMVAPSADSAKNFTTC